GGRIHLETFQPVFEEALAESGAPADGARVSGKEAGMTLPLTRLPPCYFLMLMQPNVAISQTLCVPPSSFTGCTGPSWITSFRWQGRHAFSSTLKGNIKHGK